MSKFNSSWIDRSVFYRKEHNAEHNCPHFKQYERPVIVCLCGSTRFKQEFIDANFRETRGGKIVTTVGWFSHADGEVWTPTPADKEGFDELHKRKIDLADEVLILNVDGYVGSSTRSEVLYAAEGGKTVRWLEPFKVPPDLAHIGDSLSDGPQVHRDSDNDPDKIGA